MANMFGGALYKAVSHKMPEAADGCLPPGDEEEEALDDPDEWRDYSDE